MRVKSLVVTDLTMFHSSKVKGEKDAGETNEDIMEKCSRPNELNKCSLIS